MREITEGTLEEWCAKVCAFAALYEVRDRVKLAFYRHLMQKPAHR